MELNLLERHEGSFKLTESLWVLTNMSNHIYSLYNLSTDERMTLNESVFETLYSLEDEDEDEDEDEEEEEEEEDHPTDYDREMRIAYFGTTQVF